MPKLAIDTKIVEHNHISDNVKELVLFAPEIVEQAKPGQFIHLKITDGNEPLLRRPISIASVDLNNGLLTLIYRIAGNGTKKLATLKQGDVVNCLGPLGNGFALDFQKPLLVGGGIGMAPLIFLAQRLLPCNIDILMGGRTKTEMCWHELFQDIVEEIHITTDDGSLGTKGFTVDLLPDLLKTGKYDGIYVCGPHVMMEKVSAIAKEYNIPCQVSLEKHMACGIGACLSCTCQSKDGSRKKVCSDGPVFYAEEVF